MGDMVEAGSTGGAASAVVAEGIASGQVTEMGGGEAEKAPRPDVTATGIQRPAWLAPKPVSVEKTPGTEESTGEDAKATESKQAAPSGPDAGEKKPGEAEAAPPPDDAKKTDSAGKEPAAPKGYVPKEALAEARGESRYLKEQLTSRESRIAELEAELAKKPAATPKGNAAGEFDGFKVLSDAEIEEMADEDPVGAAEYAKKLIKFERYQAEQKDLQAKADARKQELGVKSGIAKNRIAELIPNSETHDKLAKFVVESGMSPESFILTNPDTMVVIDGEQVPLNNIAANLVETLAGLMEKMGSQALPEITAEMVPDAIKEQIIAAAQEEILGKVKNPKTVRTTSTIPSAKRAEGGSRFAGKTYAQLSPEERRAYLAGEDLQY